MKINVMVVIACLWFAATGFADQGYEAMPVSELKYWRVHREGECPTKVVAWDLSVVNTGDTKHGLEALMPDGWKCAEEAYLVCVSVDDKKRCYTVEWFMEQLDEVEK